MLNLKSDIFASEPFIQECFPFAFSIFKLDLSNVKAKQEAFVVLKLEEFSLSNGDFVSFFEVMELFCIVKVAKT